jgi:hypothetical protein
MISDEQFFAWLDGELAPEEAAAIGTLVAADPDLQRRADAHRALAGRLGAAFDPIAEAPVPAYLLESTRPREAEVIDFGAAKGRRSARPVPLRMQWAAMAATLAIGILAGSMINGGAASLITQEDGRLVASGELEQALYTRLASAPSDQGTRIGLTFRDAAGDLCRSFTDGGAAGLACHQGGDWRVRGLFQAGEGQQSEFRMAAGPDPRLADLVDSTMAGEPLDAAAERQALDSLR